MLRKILSLIICGIFFVAGGIIIAQAYNDTKAGTSLIAQAQDVGNKICPVMGNPIVEDAKVTYEYEGKVYNFCCDSCIGEFKKDPAKYIKIIEEEKNGPQPAVSK